jgi:hypothetical protein
MSERLQRKYNKYAALKDALDEKKAYEMIDAFPEERMRGFLLCLLRTRRPIAEVSINGRTVIWKRSVLVDYLRGKYPDVKNKRQTT